MQILNVAQARGRRKSKHAPADEFLPHVRRLGAPLVSIGGAGTFDGVFLTGILAVLLA